MEDRIIKCFIFIILLGLLIKFADSYLFKNVENMDDIAKKLDKKYEQIGDNVIYGANFEKMYEIGNFYFKQGMFDKMLKYYRPIIDQFNRFNVLNDDPVIIDKNDVFKLYRKVQYDIGKSVEVQNTCKDFQSCLDVNPVLPTII